MFSDSYTTCFSLVAIYFLPNALYQSQPGDIHSISQGRVITSEKQRKYILEARTSELFRIKSLALKESQHRVYAKNTRLDRIGGDGESQVFQAELRYRISKLERRKKES